MGNAKHTWSLDEFHGGIDLRDGDFSTNQTGFRVRDNVWTTKGKKVKRRPPCKQTAGVFDPETQGLFRLNGRKTTFAKKDDDIINTLDIATEVDVLYFDNPDYCTDWTLINFGVYNNQAYAWILHDYQSTAYQKIAMLHVWDLLLYAPTYVQDPHLPGSFSPSIADLESQTYDSTFLPVVGQGASRLATSTLRGNTHKSGIEDGRVWNQRSKDSFLTDGEWWCFVVPEGNLTVRSFLVPRDATWMNIDGRWSYYVLEYAADGVWTPMVEVTATPSVAYTWRYQSVTSRFTGGWNEVQVDVCWGSGSAGLIRLRLVAGATSLSVITEPTAEIIPGTGAQYKVSLSDSKWMFRAGDSETTAAHETSEMADNKTYLLGVSADNTSFPELVDITTTFPTGWQREHYHFFKKIVTNSGLTTSQLNFHSSWAVETLLTGTVTTVNGSNAVVGVGTLFTSELIVGDTIRINSVDRVISIIVDNLNLNTTAVWSTNNTGAALVRLNGYAKYIAGETKVFLDEDFAGALAVTQVITIGGTDYTVFAINGQYVTVRNAAGAAGDFTSTLNNLLTVIREGVPVVSDYTYAYEASAESQWYTERVLEYTEIAGLDNATSLATSSHNNTGGLITSISSINRRMLVTYKETMQLWAIDQNTANYAFLDDMKFGTGDQPTPVAVEWYGEVILPVANSFRSVAVVGANNDNLQDGNIGEPIEAMPYLKQLGGTFWATNGQVVISGTTTDGFEFRVYDYSKESKISAWSRWVVADLVAMDANCFAIEGSKLFLRSDDKMYYFDYASTSFIDFSDTPGDAYESRSRFRYNNMNKPGYDKEWMAMDIVQIGKSTISFELPQYGTSFQNNTVGPVINGPTIKGVTYGASRYPVVMRGNAVAPVIVSKSETGWELQSFSLDYKLLKR